MWGREAASAIHRPPLLGKPLASTSSGQAPAVRSAGVQQQRNERQRSAEQLGLADDAGHRLCVDGVQREQRRRERRLSSLTLAEPIRGLCALA